MTSPCKYEKEIGSLGEILIQLKKEVFGNGRPGLSVTIPELKAEIKNLNKTVESHTAIVSNIQAFHQSLQSKESKEKEIEDREVIAENLEAQRKRDKLQKFFWIVAAVVGIVGIWVSVYFGSVNSKKTTITESTEVQILKAENAKLKQDNAQKEGTINILAAPGRGGTKSVKN